MATGTVTERINIGSMEIAATVTKTDDATTDMSVTLAAGQGGAILSQSGGTITMDSAEHTITDAHTVSVFWTASGVQYCRYACTVSLVDGTTVTLTDGSGDALPADATEVVVGIRQELTFVLDGDEISMIAAACDQVCQLEFAESDETAIAAYTIASGASWRWVDDGNTANPLTGDPIGKLYVSPGSETAGTFSLAALYNVEA